MMFPDDEIKSMLDLNGRKTSIVQVQTAYNPGLGITLWVNVDGICRLRIGGIDPRKFQQDLVSIPESFRKSRS